MDNTNSILSYIHSGSVVNSLLSIRQSSFKTSMFGYDKEAIMQYINDIYRTATEQDRRVNETVNNLSRKNYELTSTLTRYEEMLRRAKDDYENKIRSLERTVEKDSDYTGKTREREELYKNSITNLKDKVSELQKGIVAEKQSNETLQSQIKQATEVVSKLREDIAQKEQMINAVNGELYRRDSIIAQRNRDMEQKDFIMTSKDTEISRLDSALSKKNSEILNLRDYITNLEQHIEQLESSRSEISSAIYEAASKAQEKRSEQEKQFIEVREVSEPITAKQSSEDARQRDDEVVQKVNDLSIKADELRQQLERVSGQFALLENNIYRSSMSSQENQKDRNYIISDNAATQTRAKGIPTAVEQFGNNSMPNDEMHFWQPSQDVKEDSSAFKSNVVRSTSESEADRSAENTEKHETASETVSKPKFEFSPTTEKITIPGVKRELNSFEKLNGVFPLDDFGNEYSFDGSTLTSESRSANK